MKTSYRGETVNCNNLDLSNSPPVETIFPPVESSKVVLLVHRADIFCERREERAIESENTPTNTPATRGV